ncbi:MAG: methyltransferase domain-containing protein [Planctomycetota bacterium]
MAENTEAAVYDETAEKMWRWIQKPFAREALRHLPPGGRILDLGTGPGQMPVYWARKRPDAEVTAVDLSAAMLRIASDRARRFGVGSRVKFVLADATDTGLPSGHYDVVVCHYMLHHFENPAAVLREMARLARPGGVVLARDLARPHPLLARASTLFTTVFLRNSRAQNQQYADSLAASYRAGELRAAVRRADLPDLEVKSGPVHVLVRRLPKPSEAARQMTHERAGRILAGASLLASLVLAQVVSPWFLLVAAGTGMNLALSGITNRCAVKNLLIRLGFPGERDLGRAEALAKAQNFLGQMGVSHHPPETHLLLKTPKRKFPALAGSYKRN